jgi:hypothetical protein
MFGECPRNSVSKKEIETRETMEEFLPASGLSSWLARQEMLAEMR